MKIVFSFIVLLAASISEASTFQCNGSLVSGIVQMRESGENFSATSTLSIQGRKHVLKNTGSYSSFQQEILFGGGAWRPDANRRVYALGGANLNLSGWSEGFHLEINVNSPNVAEGYLGHRDHRAGPSDNSSFDFTCSRVR